MLNPSKVVAFLDWDRDRLLVMAYLEYSGHYFVTKRNRPVFDASFDAIVK